MPGQVSAHFQPLSGSPGYSCSLSVPHLFAVILSSALDLEAFPSTALRKCVPRGEAQPGSSRSVTPGHPFTFRL